MGDRADSEDRRSEECRPQPRWCPVGYRQFWNRRSLLFRWLLGKKGAALRAHVGTADLQVPPTEGRDSGNTALASDEDR